MCVDQAQVNTLHGVLGLRELARNILSRPRCILLALTRSLGFSNCLLRSLGCAVAYALGLEELLLQCSNLLVRLQRFLRGLLRSSVLLLSFASGVLEGLSGLALTVLR